MAQKEPDGCVRPDCFNCPFKDCKVDKGTKESTEINKVINKYIKWQRKDKLWQ